MRRVWTSLGDKTVEQTAKVYFDNKAGVYPGFLVLVLNDESMPGIAAKIRTNQKLNEKEKQVLVKTYVKEQARYKQNCRVIASWGGLNPDLLFVQSLGTDVSGSIYSITDEELAASVKHFSTMPIDKSKKAKRRLARNILNMSEEEINEFRKKQREMVGMEK
jgi:hypothetical protein